MNQQSSDFTPDTALMRAVRVTAPGAIRVEDLPLPEPGPGQVRIRVEGCGVCASNLEPWAGPDWIQYPTGPGGLGHEGWGRIDAAGEGVTGLAPGQRVVWLGQASYATHELVDAALVLPLPDSIAGPFPGEPFGCAMNVFLRSGIGPGDRVAIIGIGFIGAVVTRLAANVGAEVIAISRRDSSLTLARRMGAARTVRMDDHHRIIAEVADLTAHRFCDVVVEAVGQQWPLDLAGEIVAEGGRLVIAGYHQDGPRQVNMQNWNWRGIDVINAHERNPQTCLRGIAEAIRAIEAGRLDPAPLLTHRFSLDALDRALDATRDKPDGLVKAWVACT